MNKSKHPAPGTDDTRGLAMLAAEGYGASAGSLQEKRLRRFDSIISKAEQGERLDKQDVALLKRLRDKIRLVT
jgi:hypothetical protein